MNSQWEFTRFSELFKWSPKSNIGSRQGKANGKYPLYIASATEIKYYDNYLESGESLVFGTGGNPCIHYVNGDFAYTNHTEVAKKKTDNICTKFYYYYFQKGKYSLLASTFVGGGIKNSSKKKIGDLSVPIVPKKEQERIVSLIEELFSELDSGIETLKKTKEQLRVYRQAVLKEAFEGRLSNNLKVTEKLEWIDESNTAELPKIPKEWHYISLSKLGDLGRGKSKHRPRNDAILFENGKYPFIQTGDVKAAKRFVTDYSKMYGEEGLKQSKLWPKGTLCITIAANIAETAFLGINACFPDSIVGFTPNKYIISEYVKYFIESEKIRLWAFAPATAQKNINLDTLEKLIIPYCTITEQRAIVDEIETRMSVCDNIENTVNFALQQAEALRQSILKEAFEGRL